jgi:hypothetical protein
MQKLELITTGFISECQTVDLAQQLRDGCRFVDIRLKVVDNELKSECGMRNAECVSCGMERVDQTLGPRRDRVLRAAPQYE